MPGADHLIVYGRNVSMPPQHVRRTLELVNRFWAWSGVTDLTEWSERISRDITVGTLPELPDDAVQIISQADEVCLHTLWRPFEKFILDLAPRARIFLFDNGLDSHLERAVAVSEDDLAQGRIRRSDLKRVDRFMYTLGDMIPPPSFAQEGLISVPRAGELREHYRLMAGKAGLVSRSGHGEAPSALSLGTSFYRLGKFAVEDEAAVYSRFHKDVRDLGYGVIWKSHPRTGKGLMQGSDNALSEPLDQSLPIEFLPLQSNIALSGSMSSTALLTLKKAFGIPFVVLGSQLAQRLSLPWSEVLHRYAEDKLPARRLENR